VNKPIPNSFRAGPDENGRFGIFGGRFVAETLVGPLQELATAYDAARIDPAGLVSFFEKLEKKAEAGTNVIFTQPIYEMQTLEKFLKRIEHLHIPLMLGILPLRGTKHAEFLHNEVPGMTIPDGIRDQMRRAGDHGPAVGIEISRTFLKEARHLVAGAYMMPPFQKYHIIDELLEVIR